MRTLFRRRLQRPRSRRQGQALVEFVLVIPILLLLVFGLMDFARAWSAHHSVADAAREGARLLVVNDVDYTGADAAIRQTLAAARLHTSEDRLTIQFRVGDDSNPWEDKNNNTGAAGTGEAQSVRITYKYDFWLLGPFIGLGNKDGMVNLVSTITMRGE
jgi:Flp pilus assembly protein TadG